MIQDLKDLKALFKLCRNQGITDFEMGNIKIKFGELPSEQSINQLPDDQLLADQYAQFPTDIMTPEQLAHYANGGTPQNDPFNKELLP